MYLRTNSRFKKVVPNFNIANATIHFDELSPYLHIVSVPFKDGLKNGIEKHKKQLNELNNKVESLQNKPNEISDIINNLKPTMINKNNYMISNEDIDRIKDYIEKINNTTSDLKNSNDLSVILDEYEEDIIDNDDI